MKNYPLVNIQKAYGKWPIEVVDLPVGNDDFPIAMSNYQRVLEIPLLIGHCRALYCLDQGRSRLDLAGFMGIIMDCAPMKTNQYNEMR